jgi:membrane-associated phospholipid phosphatase
MNWSLLLLSLFLFTVVIGTLHAQGIPEIERMEMERMQADSALAAFDVRFNLQMRENIDAVLAPRTVENVMVHMPYRPTLVQKLIGAGFLTGALIVSDDRSAVQSERLYRRSRSNALMSDTFVSLGDGAPHLGLAGAFAVFGWATDDTRSLRTASRMVRAILGTGLVVQTLKRIAGRQRPSHATHPRGNWRPFPNQRMYHRNIPAFDAFPSGHIATTTTTLTVLMESYPEATWLRPVSYAIIGVVGFGLANSGMHWYSDFPLGIVLGHLIGRLATHSAGVFDEEPQCGTGPFLTVGPLLTEGRSGVELRIDF